MQVLLINDVDRVGKKGETKKVTEGYARNFLFPRKLAMPVTAGTMNNLKLLQASWKRQEHQEKEAFQKMAQQLESATYRITRKAGEKGRLFGSVTSTELAELFHRESKVEVDKRNIQADHIKELGQHEVTIRFSGEVKATVKVVVLPEETTEPQS